MINHTGILLTNIGTPREPTPRAVRRYLRKFLNDKRVVELPRWVWWPVLYSFVLPFRSKKSAKLYQSIWTDEGSPLLVNTENLRARLEHRLNLPVALGMHYSSPSIKDALYELKSKQVSRILILPLYPQYSGTTTASTFDTVFNVLKTWRTLPEIRTINHYASHPHYIQAICESIRKTWATHEKSHLLFSYHGIPKKYILAGDPYQSQCSNTTQSIVKELQLADSEWSMGFQSKVGRGEWISPSTEDMLSILPKKGIVNLTVICPGFATDCLETLEEIKIRGAEQFLKAGGKSFHYIPALNDNDEHITMLENIISSNLQG